MTESGLAVDTEKEQGVYLGGCINREEATQLRDFLKEFEIGKSKLVADNGYCPATDLIIDKRNTELIENRTNFKKLKQELIDKYKKEETDNILSKLRLLEEYVKG